MQIFILTFHLRRNWNRRLFINNYMSYLCYVTYIFAYKRNAEQLNLWPIPLPTVSNRMLYLVNGFFEEKKTV